MPTTGVEDTSPSAAAPAGLEDDDDAAAPGAAAAAGIEDVEDGDAAGVAPRARKSALFEDSDEEPADVQMEDAPQVRAGIGMHVNTMTCPRSAMHDVPVQCDAPDSW